MGKRFNRRTQGPAIKHRRGKVLLNTHNQCGDILKIEITVNNVFPFSTAAWSDRERGEPSLSGRR